MRDEKKKMKKYIKSVERKLNLPKDIKTRVMSDFVSSINARQEAGQTFDQILAELGNAKKAAADLNEQMKEFSYRKSPWRFVFLALAVYGAGKLLSGLWGNIVYLAVRALAYFPPSETASVGIIGGADGPTAIFVTTPGWMHYVLPAGILILGIWGFLRLGKCKQ